MHLRGSSTLLACAPRLCWPPTTSEIVSPRRLFPSRSKCIYSPEPRTRRCAYSAHRCLSIFILFADIAFRAFDCVFNTLLHTTIAPPNLGSRSPIGLTDLTQLWRSQTNLPPARSRQVARLRYHDIPQRIGRSVNSSLFDLWLW